MQQVTLEGLSLHPATSGRREASFLSVCLAFAPIENCTFAALATAATGNTQ